MKRILSLFLCILWAASLCVIPTTEASECENYLPLNDGLEKNVWGMLYRCNDGVYHISGTPKKSSYLNLMGGENSIPGDLKKGDRLKIWFSSGTKYVTLGIRAFNAENPDGTWLLKTSTDTEFIVPNLSKYRGVSIRITVSQSNRCYDLKLRPIIEKCDAENRLPENILPENNQLTKNVWGMQYRCENGIYHISGTPKKSSYLNLMGGENIVPKELKEGQRLQIRFGSGTNYVTLGIRAFNAEHPDGTWLLKTSTDTVFTVPDLSGYTGVSIRITVSQNSKHYDLKLTPVIREIQKQPSYLTIIDDDGDRHYLTDLLPLMQELQVPISTAVSTLRVGSARRWMNWNDLVSLNKAGYEILCHTYSHISSQDIVNVDDDTLYSNYQKARNELLRRGIAGGDFLVYSSGTGNYARVRAIAERVFKCGIKIGGSQINTADSNVFHLSRYRIDYAASEGRTDWNLDDMKSYVDEVSAVGGWQIWMLHTSNAIYRQRVCLDVMGNVLYENGKPIPMTDGKGNPVLDVDGTYPTMGSTVFLPMLKEAILYAKEKGVQIVTVKQAYDAMYQTK